MLIPKAYISIAAVALAAAAALSTVDSATVQPVAASQFRVDPFWPRPLPKDSVTGKQWVTGEVAGTCVDSQDHVFIVTRGFQNGLVSPETVIAVASPPVIEFDQVGRVVNAWGDPAVLPNGVHGCFVDYQDNVWIAGNGDGIVVKFNHSGQHLMTIGTKGICDNPPANTCGNSGANPLANQSRTLLNQPANMYVDPNPDPVTGQPGSVYIADGYGNHRVVVFSANGTYLRQWGGVAGTVVNPVTDSPGLFAAGDGGHPHCIRLANDGLVYVCDRGNDRIQVFTKQGALVRIIPVVPGTGVTGTAPLGTAGSAWDVDFSKDAMQSLMYEVDGGNELMHVMSRALGSILSSFGGPGHEAGKFTFLHSVVVDSKQNLYLGETIGGRRVQRFVPTRCNANGLGNAPGSCL
jgi:hypothetical protein